MDELGLRHQLDHIGWPAGVKIDMKTFGDTLEDLAGDDIRRQRGDLGRTDDLGRVTPAEKLWQLLVQRVSKRIRMATRDASCRGERASPHPSQPSESPSHVVRLCSSRPT